VAATEGTPRSFVSRRTVLALVLFVMRHRDDAALVKLGLARYFVGNPGGHFLNPDGRTSVFCRQPLLFHPDVLALGLIGDTNTRALFRNRGIPATPAGEEKEEPDRPSLAPRLGAPRLGARHAG